MGLISHFATPLPQTDVLGQLIAGFDQGQKDRTDRLALDAAAKAFGTPQTQRAPQADNLNTLMGLTGYSGAPAAATPAQPQAQTPAQAAITAATRPVNGAMSDTSNIPQGYIAAARASESGGNDAAANPNSSALGRYQFLEGTWNGLMQQYPELGLTPEGRTDPAQQERAMKVFTRDNAGVLSNAGIPVNPGSLYAAHFLGAGGAQKVLTADPNTPMAALVDPGVIQANPQLQGMTAGAFSEWAQNKGGNSAGGYQAPMQDVGAGQGQPFTPDPETLRALLASEATRPLAVSLIQAQQETQASQGRFVTEQGQDGSIWQRDTVTGAKTVLQDAPTPTQRRIVQGPDGNQYYEDGSRVLPGVDAPAVEPARPMTSEERNAWGIPASDARPYTFGKDGVPEPIGGSGQTINVNNGGDNALDGALSKAEGEDWATYKEAATVSASNAQDFEILGELLQQAPQGPVTGRLADTFKGFSAAGDAANSIIKRIAPTLRAPGSGATSDIEYNGMLQSLPSLAQSPEANAMVLAIMQAKAQINMERGRIISEYQRGDLTVDEARMKMDALNSQSIMTPEMKKALLGIGSDGQVGEPPPAVGEEVDGYIYNGGDPSSPTSWTQVN